MTRRNKNNLSEAAALINAVKVSDACPPALLKEMLTEARLLENAVSGLITDLCVQAERNSELDVESFLLDQGQASTSKVRKEVKYGKALSLVPELDGRKVESEKLLEVANQLGKLDESDLAKLDTSSISADAQNLPTATFKSKLRREVEKVSKSKRLEDNLQLRSKSEVVHWFDRSLNMGVVRALLDPERYEIVANAIDSETAGLSIQTDGETSRDKNLAASAFVNLISSAASSSPSKPKIMVLVDSESLTSDELSTDSVCETEAGNQLPFETVQRLACDAILQAVRLHKSGSPLDVGRSSRTATPAQWSAAKSIYSACAWGGCDTRIQWCQLHHIHEWQDGGKTDFNNLVPLCSKHHHKVHEGKWSIRLKPDRSLEHYTPSGQLWSTGDPPTRRLSEKEDVEESGRLLGRADPEYDLERGQLGIAV